MAKYVPIDRGKKVAMYLNDKLILRLQIIKQLDDGLITNAQSAQKLGLSLRQIIRIKQRYKLLGAEGLLHRGRGKPKSYAIPKELKKQIIDLFNEVYSGLNFTHFSEKLSEKEGIRLSRSSIDRILREAGLRSKKGIKRKRIAHHARPRLENPGALWQGDATSFRWFKGDDRPYTLHCWIDDATGIVTGAYFTLNECSIGYIEALRQGMERYGLPMALYTDNHTIFRSSKKLTEEEQISGMTVNLTDFGRGLDKLNINHIFAHSPQAKGRIERLWRTFQDRLTAEIQLNEITFEQANDFVKTFIEDYNNRFQVEASKKEVYRAVPQELNFNLIFGHHETRKTDLGGVLLYKGLYYTSQNNQLPRKTRIEIIRALDGSIYAITNSEYSKLVEIAKPLKVKSSKIIPRKQYKPPIDHPWRRYHITKPDYKLNDEKAILPTTIPSLRSFGAG